MQKETLKALTSDPKRPISEDSAQWFYDKLGEHLQGVTEEYILKGILRRNEVEWTGFNS